MTSPHLATWLASLSQLQKRPVIESDNRAYRTIIATLTA
jgi:hypothetical protein